jgi:hypothetical protein
VTGKVISFWVRTGKMISFVWPAAAAGAVLPTAEYALLQARISGWHIGCYAFKGCGLIDMVAFTCQENAPNHPMSQDSMQHQQHQQPQQQVQGGGMQQLLGKGMLLVARSGPVVGLQNCPVLLPSVLPVLQEAWGVAAEVASKARPARTSGGGQQQQQQQQALW